MKWASLGWIAGITALAWAIVTSENIIQPKTRTDGRVVVTYWEKWSDFEADAMRAVVNEFNESQDKIFVEYNQVPNIGQKTMLATSGGIPPDVAGLDGTRVAQYAYNNAVIPLDELAANAGLTRDHYIHQYYDMCNYGGKLWAMPSTPACTALHYNKDILKEVGLDPENPPQTIEQLDELDRLSFKKENGKITRMGFLPSEPGWWNWSWPGFFGGQLWDGESKITMSTPENIRAYEWVGGFAKKYGSGTTTSFKESFAGTFKTAQNPIMNGRLASEIQGVWMANFIQTYQPKLNWAASPFPHPADRPDLANSTVLDLDILVIPRGAKHPKEAFEFIKFVQSQHGMELLCFGQKKHSPLAQVSPEFIAKHPNPFIQVFQDAANGKNTISTPKTPIWPQWSEEIGAATQAINNGTKTPKQALQYVEEKMQPHLDKVRRREVVLGLVTAKKVKN